MELQERLWKIRVAVSRILRKTPLVNEECVQILELLEELDQDPAMGDREARAEQRVASKRQYVVEVQGGRERLLERRDGRAPMVAFKEFYEAFAETLASNPGSFEELCRVGGIRPDQQYQGRVVLRYWKDAGMIRHSARKYAPTPGVKHFPAAARELWARLSQDRCSASP